MKKTCARCGKVISVIEYIYNNKDYKILGVKWLLHFCDKCYCIIKEN